MLLLEQQITSLELSKRLCELGVKQESLFYWADIGSGFKIFGKDIIDIENSIHPSSYIENWAAFTVSELGDLLKCGLQSALIVDTATNKIKEFQVFSPYYNIYQLAETEVDARAKILIHLIENKLIEVKD